MVTGDAEAPRRDDADRAVVLAAAARPVVLLIDDMRAQIDVCELHLRDRYGILRTTRGGTGYCVACIERPDVIVVDLPLPDVDGWTVCRMLRANPITSRIPIVVLAALDDEHEPARHAGATNVLIKPCTVDGMLRAIEQALGAAA